MRPYSQCPLVPILPEQVLDQVPVREQIFAPQLRGFERAFPDVPLDGGRHLLPVAADERRFPGGPEARQSVNLVLGEPFAPV